MMKKKLLALALVTMMAASGCGSKAADTREESTAVSESVTEAAEETTEEAAEEPAEEEAAAEAVSQSEAAETAEAADDFNENMVNYHMTTQEFEIVDPNAEPAEETADDSDSRFSELTEGNDGASAKIIGTDNRETIPEEYQAYYPFTCVVLVETEFSDGTVYDVTGSLVGKSTVLTAGSNLVDPTKDIWPVSVTVAPMFTMDSELPLGTYTASEIYIYEEYYNSLQGLSGDDWYSKSAAKYDLGIIKLEEKLGDTLGYFGMQTYAGDMKDLEVMTVGYADDGSLKGMDGTIKSSDTDMIRFEMDTDATQNGSPIFVKNDDDCSIVGIYTANNRSENVGVRITIPKMSWIKLKDIDIN